MKRVLIVDDEIAVAAVFESALRKEGFEVKVAADGKTGIDLAKAEHFDLILLDQMLPDINGNEILKVLKSTDNVKNTPVMMLSNFGHDAMVTEALASGAKDYILKYQVSIDDLVKKVREASGEGV